MCIGVSLNKNISQCFPFPLSTKYNNVNIKCITVLCNNIKSWWGFFFKSCVIQQKNRYFKFFSSLLCKQMFPTMDAHIWWREYSDHVFLCPLVS